MESTQLSFDYKEIVELLVRKAGVKEGHWQLTINFALGASNLGPTRQDLKPGVVIAVNSIGISRVDEPTNLSVEAATVWSERQAA
jgi:hypothetical protein